MTVIRKKKIDKAFEIYLALYQGLTNYDEDLDAYREFSPDFFDLIVVDECHRGSAAADSAWREILDYFSSATQIGLTATPRETDTVPIANTLGDPIYTYSLKQGIDDGFLAPYKVIRVGINVDLEGFRPQAGQLDLDGNPIDDRLYNTKDFDRHLVIDERTKVVAGKVTEYLRKTSLYEKTIVFCIDIEHATRMRQALAIENAAEVLNAAPLRKSTSRIRAGLNFDPVEMPMVAEAPVVYHKGGQAALPAANQPAPACILAMHPGRDYSRADLLAASGIGEADWTWAIKQLKEQGRVKQVGEKRGSRYSLN